MPDLSVVAPAAVVPADRLALGATDARSSLLGALPLAGGTALYCTANQVCMADE